MKLEDQDNCDYPERALPVADFSTVGSTAQVELIKVRNSPSGK